MVALPGGTPALQVEKARMSKLNGPSLRAGIDFGCNAASLPTPQAMPPESVDFVRTPRLDFEEWRAFLRTTCGNQLDVIDPSAFTGWARPISVCGLAAAALKIECGFTALDSGRNAYQSERTHRDARIVGVDYYYAVFQLAGRSVFTQNDEVMQLAVGDVALLDAVRPAACFADDSQWLRLQLPRQSLVSHLGCEPQGGLYARGGMPAARLLFDLVRDVDKADESASSSADSYMQLAVYDLLGALFASSDPRPISRHADKLFARIRDLVKDGFADPDVGPREVAAVAGISLRYLQKLFTERGSTCSEFIYSLRLDHAARLLHRRASLGTGQPLSEIAYACGFRDYTHFARRFRHRFGYPPGGRAEGETVRAGTGERAPRAHDVRPPAV
jgi:AraC family transcriptional regulator, positive regulator of tynA and feaB